MKSIFKCIIAAALAVLIAAQIPVQAASKTVSEGKYISEIKLGFGKNSEEAEAALDGYEILKDANGNYVDLNRNAGTTNYGGKGNKVVYLGYIRTTSDKDAITDLATMNMQGGYKIEDYRDLMEAQMSAQILPFVEGFIAAIKEYRENYHSSNPENKARAVAVHDALNKLLDEDCDEAGLGDLLLNETKYEMGDAKYNALSESEKKKHADIVTIVQQAHGNAVLLMENLIIRACDTNEDTWIDRFLNTTYYDLLREEGYGLGSNKGKKALDLLYYDDAMKIVDMWDAFNEILNSFDESAVALSKVLDAEIPEPGIDLQNTTIMNATDQELEAYANETTNLIQTVDLTATEYENVMIGPYLDSIDYKNGTLLDFFKQPADTIKDDITVLYPLVASLTEGQRAGLECITLIDLIIFALTDENGYKEFDLKTDLPYSIYAGVDRGIYDYDNVALTSDAIREGKTGLDQNIDDGFALSMWTKIMAGLTAASAVGMGASVVFYVRSARLIQSLEKQLETMNKNLKAFIAPDSSPLGNLSTKLWEANRSVKMIQSQIALYEGLIIDEESTAIKWYHSEERKAQIRAETKVKVAEYRGKLKTLEIKLNKVEPQYKLYESLMKDTKAEISAREAAIASKKSQIATRSRLSKGLMAGSTILTLAIAGFTAYMVYKDYKAMADRYKVTFTVIPRYMIDSKDLVSYNDKGEKIVLKNQSAYYTAALCNRKSGDEYFETVGDVGDLNGDVGKQWLALYYEKNENKQPILVDSILITNKQEIPSGYQNGIHMFGTEAALNLNNNLYCWNSGAPSIFVYFKLDPIKVSATGSVFSPGTAAIFGLGGIVIGSLATALIMTLVKKKKETTVEA